MLSDTTQSPLAFPCSQTLVPCQESPFFDIFKNLHLTDRDLVEFFKSFALGKTVVDEDRVEIFKIAKADQLLYCRMVSDIS